MKKILLPILAASLLAGCNILDKEPLTTIAPTTFFQTAADAEAGLTAVYDALQATGLYSQDLIVMGEMPSDNCTSDNNDVRRMEELTWLSTTGQNSNLYRDAYVGVNRANAVLKYVPGVSMDATRRAQIIAEAKFFRALYYFDLVKAFGGVPLRLEPTESTSPAVLNLPRATEEAVYTQIIKDLTEAEADMPSRNPTRAAKGAASALLAKVYLYRRQWSEAMQAADRAIGGGYTLAGNFATLFPADNNPESILEVQNAGSPDGNNILPDLLLPNPPATYSFAKFNIPTGELLQYADTLNDNRWSFVGNTNAGHNHVSFVLKRSTNAQENGPFVYKWPGPPNGFNSPDNTYVLRLADVLLMYAEASNELNGPGGGALDKLNSIRLRAGLALLTAGSPEAASKDALRNEIDRQRRLELAFEGERWFDLVRYARHEKADGVNHAVTALDIIQQRRGSADENYLLFPIPLNETNTNPNVEQNPGY